MVQIMSWGWGELSSKSWGWGAGGVCHVQGVGDIKYVPGGGGGGGG